MGYLGLWQNPDFGKKEGAKRTNSHVSYRGGGGGGQDRCVGVAKLLYLPVAVAKLLYLPVAVAKFLYLSVGVAKLLYLHVGVTKVPVLTCGCD